MNPATILPTVRTSHDLDELFVGSVVAYIGDEPNAPAVACKTYDGWQFLGEDPERRRRSTDLAPETPGDLVLRVLHNPVWDAALQIAGGNQP